MKKAQLSIYLDPEVFASLEAHAKHQGKPKSLVAEAAIASFLSPDDSDRREAAIAKRLFPEGELKDLSPDDEIYSLQYILPKPNRPRLRGLVNGSRLLWVHSPTDLAVHAASRLTWSETMRRRASTMKLATMLDPP